MPVPSEPGANVTNVAREPRVKVEPQDGNLDNRDPDEAAFFIKQVKSLEGYSHFFNAVYSIPPKLETSDVEATLNQCEALVGVASYLGGVSAVRIFVSNSLTELRHELYTAIALDPVRWLNLSVRLKSKAIFSEALIHCAGGFPDARWLTPTTEIIEEAREITFAKATALDSWARRVEMHLLKTTLHDQNSGKSISPAFGRGSWVVLSIFRNWLLNRERELDELPNQCQFARIFRQIHKGGDEYLQVNEVDAQVSEILGPKSDFSAEETLKKLKRWAKEVVAQLVKNNLMIDPNTMDIPYLTCTGVGDKDFPWIQD